MLCSGPATRKSLLGVLPEGEALDRDVPEAILEILRQALDRVPDRRFPSARAMQIALTRCLFSLGEIHDGHTLAEFLRGVEPQLPPPQQQLQVDYKEHLREQFGVRFNSLLTLANLPIQRFGSTLISRGQFDGYMALLKSAHQPANVPAVMCRSLPSI